MDISQVNLVLNTDNKAVEQGVMTLRKLGLLEGRDIASGEYFGTWIARGNHLTGEHLGRARKMLFRYADKLASLAEKKNTPVSRNLRQSLNMDRSGSFEVSTYGKNPCGLTKKVVVRYGVVIKCNTQLDNRGFIVDQMNVDAFFNAIKRTNLSCENLCIQSAKDLMAKIQEENPGIKIESLRLTLSPAPHSASITYMVE